MRPDECIQIFWPTCALPEDAVEGAVLDISVQVSEAETEAAAERAYSSPSTNSWAERPGSSDGETDG